MTSIFNKKSCYTTLLRSRSLFLSPSVKQAGCYTIQSYNNYNHIKSKGKIR